MRHKRTRRTFSVEFKKQKVAQIEKGTLTVSQLAKMLAMSPSPIYQWLNKYGSGSITEKIVIETESDFLKFVESQKQVTKMEKLIGQQQMKISFYEELLSEIKLHYGDEVISNFLKK